MLSGLFPNKRTAQKGKTTLERSGEWQPVTDENKAGMRFFGTEVVLP